MVEVGEMMKSNQIRGRVPSVYDLGLRFKSQVQMHDLIK